jgi:hypothetical protein
VSFSWTPGSAKPPANAGKSVQPSRAPALRFPDP